MTKLLVLLVAIGSLLAVASAEPKDSATPAVFPEIKGGDVKVEYHRFTLIKHDNHIIALHLLPDPRHGWDGITYRWYGLSDGTDTFFLPTPEEADSAPNPRVTTGAGETDEGEKGNGEIITGALTFKWSKGSDKAGWLYLSEAGDDIQVYPKQFDRLDEFSGKLDSRLWKRAN